jgi:hypothetical protein
MARHQTPRRSRLDRGSDRRGAGTAGAPDQEAAASCQCAASHTRSHVTGDMPNEQQLRTIAAASLNEQKEVWKAHKPKKSERADWYNISRTLSKTRMFATDASFGDNLATAYGIEPLQARLTSVCRSPLI